MLQRKQATVTVEEYLERRTETAAGRVVWRRYRRARWEPPTAERSTAQQVVETAVPLLRAVAIAMAPALGTLALRALAPRLRASLPRARRPRVLVGRILPPRPLPPPVPFPEEGGPLT